VLAFLCLRLALAAILGFGVDESYTIGNARDLRLSLSIVPPCTTGSCGRSSLFFADPPSPWRTWVLAGIWIGLAALSKFQALLFGFGVLLYLGTVPQRRRLLVHPAPWVGGAIALALFSPVVIWNARHGWATFAYQGGRALARGGLHIGNALVDLAGQVAWLTPWGRVAGHGLGPR
jgi:4-amino-4-deoxy-L-arabinose transferase-like glycosyltransferase